MSNLLHVIVSGLTYEGNLRHRLINYSLIAITIAPLAVPANRVPATTRLRWIGCFLIGLAIQVLLWFSVDAVGVSIIWCTMTGYDLVIRTARDQTLAPNQRKGEHLALVRG